MADRFNRIVKNVPTYYHPSTNKNWKGLLGAYANEYDRMDNAIEDAKQQLFTLTAGGVFLDMLGSNVGVSREIIIKFIDDIFRQLIPVLSYYPKQVRPSIYKALSFFWPIYYLHATSTAVAFEPYNFAGGEILTLVVDGYKNVNVSFLASDFVNPAAATAQEVVNKINAWLPDYITAFVYTDQILNRNYVAIATKTYGLSGSIQVTGTTANTILQFPTTLFNYTKVSIEEINPNELVVRIPQYLVIPGNQKAAHRFHPNANIIDGRPNVTSANPFWPGHFFYDKLGGRSIGISSINTTLQNNITAGNNYSVLNFGNVSNFPATGGYIVFNFGLNNQEVVKYVQRINNTQLKMDATYSFRFAHIIGDIANLASTSPVVPRVTGEDYAIYFIDTALSKEIVLAFLLLLKAAGIIVRLIYT